MKVYIRKWNGKVFESDGVVNIDGYNGLCFCGTKPYCMASTTVHIKQREQVQFYLHASEPNALVVYVREVKS